MDFDELIREKRNALLDMKPDSDIESVLRHLQVAKTHFDRGRVDDDANLFTDAVYRTNQVFEGILKEIYEALTSNSASDLTPHKIEKHLERNDIFGHRVRDYLARYRTDWRNPSTHNHQLEFSEQESFLAITTVSAFCYVAIDQMIKSMTAAWVEKSQKEGASAVNFDVQAIAEFLVDQLPFAIRATAQHSSKSGLAEIAIRESNLTVELSEMHLSGTVNGLLSRLPNVAIGQEVRFDIGKRRRSADFVVRERGQDVPKDIVIELKTSKFEGRRRYKAELTNQLVEYCEIENVAGALGLILPSQIDIRSDFSLDISFEAFFDTARGKDIALIVVQQEQN